jgi:FMN phosphatase YigB (HAD superfamily)
MSRPLLVTDCDEVLLYMVTPFRAWLDEAHDIHFDFASGFARALRYKLTGEVVTHEQIQPLLRQFFTNEMHRQNPIEGAVEAMEQLSRIADIVVLTNIGDYAGDGRVHQLRRLGMDFPVVANSGSKGQPLARIIAEYDPSVTVFVDDLALNHEHGAEHAPQAWRLQMVGEPELAPQVKPCPHAHARIDRWTEAKEWILERFEAGVGAIT